MGKAKKPETKVSSTIYQFKITLKGIEPPIWRRIQAKDCTLDKLHEHIQTAMGWTNSHLHQFEINGVRHGDPQLIYEGWEEEGPPVNSRRLKISKIVPADSEQFSFDYEYDFGDGWQHVSFNPRRHMHLDPEYHDPCQALSPLVIEREATVEDVIANWQTYCVEVMYRFLELFPGISVSKDGLMGWLRQYTGEGRK